MKPFANKTNVIFIAGEHRSGSTLLARLLATASGVTFNGELELIWRQGVIEDRLCGCGVPFSACEFWEAVGCSAFGGWQNVDASALVTSQERLLKRKHVWNLMSPPRREGADAVHSAPSTELRRSTAALYSAICEVAQAHTIVDSSKTVAYAAFLLGLDEVSTNLIHLVRDPRGVANSRLKKKPVLDKPGAMHHASSPTRTALRWTVHNGLFEVMLARTGRGVRLRYEDLVADPMIEIKRIFTEHLSRAEVFGESMLAQARDTVSLPSSHSIAGNHMRFRYGDVQVKPDDEWKTALPPRTRLGVSSLALPLMRRYGYPIKWW